MQVENSVQKTLRLVLIYLSALALLGLGPNTAAASPIFSNSASDVWIVNSDGDTVGSFNVGTGGWTTSAAINGNSATVTIEGNNAIPVISLPDSVTGVLVNQMTQSSPSLVNGLTGISLKGLEAAASSLDNPDQPSHAIDPPPGQYDKTIRVRISAVGGTTNPDPVSIHWSVNEGPLQSVTATQADFFIYESGPQQVTYHVEQGALAATVPTTAVYELSAGLDAMRDSDGDGLPDAWEIANGLDPLRRDASHDSDGDGTSDFDELLRGTDPTDPDDHPTNAVHDPDCDGWSTWDENIRGTDPAQESIEIDSDGDSVMDSCEPVDRWPSTPVARRATEVEYTLAGNVWTDTGHALPRNSLGRLSVVDPYWEVFFDQLELIDVSLYEEAELAALGLEDEDDLPEWLRLTPIEAALAAGTLPPVRVPGGSGSIVRVQGETVAGSPDLWVAKTWLAPSSDLTPARYNQVNNQPWVDPSDWLQGYRDYLGANAVEVVTLDIDPASALPLSLLESAIAWHSELSEGGKVLLGNPDANSARAAVSALGATLAERNRDWVSLLAEYEPLVESTGDLANFRATVLGYFSDTGTIPRPPTAPSEAEETTETATAALVQGNVTDDDISARYMAKLYVLFSPSELLNMPEAERLSLLDPSADTDGDGITNASELAAKAHQSGNPDALDSDGDGFSDSIDPCLADANNACLALVDLEGDDDQDGVVNAIDNCLNQMNGDQADGNADAIGDACLRYANIRTPVANIRVYPGGSVNFTSVETELGAIAVGPLAYDWSFGGGAPGSTAASPGPVTFVLPGTWPVTLTVQDASMADLGSDWRTVTVLGDVPLVSIVGFGTLPEGDTLSLSAAASSPNGAITNFDWAFGDGNTDTGAQVSHSWSQNGNYSVEVIVEDVIGAPASDTLAITVTDTAPDPAFTLNRPRGPVPHAVLFSDSIPIPYDGLAAIAWDFGDGSPISSASTPTHVFITAATPQVELTATDGDGSTVSVSERLQVLTGYSLLTDSDADGISDAYESAHGPVSPATDTDDDGMNDLAEYRAGTDFQNALDTPAGNAGLSSVPFADPFDESPDLRWSQGLASSLAVTSLSQSGGRILFELQPPALGELCQTSSLVSFVTVDGEDLEVTAILDPGAAGTSCIGMLPDTDYFARAEACLVETSGIFAVELRITEGDNLSVTSGGSATAGNDLELGLTKDGADFYLSLNGSTMASDSSTGSLGDVALRPFISTESCTDDPSPVALDIEDFSVTFAPEPAQALQWCAGLAGLLLLQRRRRNRKAT